jgi:hypothetical protein
MVLQASEEDLVGTFSSLWPHLNERDRRLVAAACARAMGHGGVTAVSTTSGLSRPTVTKAISELHEEPLAAGRVRKEGAGRRPANEADPGLERALDPLVDPDSRGDPESPLRWTISPPASSPLHWLRTATRLRRTPSVPCCTAWVTRSSPTPR